MIRIYCKDCCFWEAPSPQIGEGRCHFVPVPLRNKFSCTHSDDWCSKAQPKDFESTLKDILKDVTSEESLKRILREFLEELEKKVEERYD